MTQEEKSLLLKDLSARLPYGVKVYINSPIEEQNSMELFDVNLDGEYIGVCNKKWAFRAIPIIDEDEAKVVKPYLRPMSSIASLISAKEWTSLSGIDLIDWYNANHIDYRGLIEKGLAIEVTEENNPYENDI